MTGENRPEREGGCPAVARPARCGMFTGQPGAGNAEAFIQSRSYAYAHTRQLADLA
jgi:hypothetical protein